ARPCSGARTCLLALRPLPGGEGRGDRRGGVPRARAARPRDLPSRLGPHALADGVRLGQLARRGGAVSVVGAAHGAGRAAPFLGERGAGALDRLLASVQHSAAGRETIARAAPALSPGALVVSVSKGLDPERLTTLSCVLGDVLPAGTAIAVLSGPSFAQEVYGRQPTAVVAASRDPAVALRV